MNVENVNIVGTELFQRLFTRRPTIFRGAVDENLDLAVYNLPAKTKLGREENIMAALGMQRKPLANEHLAVSVSCGGIPEGRSQLPRTIEDLESFVIGSVLVVS